MKKNFKNASVLAEGEFIIRFAGEGLVTADVVAESLLGWSDLYRRVPSILGEYHPAFRNMRLVPFVESIESGSLKLRALLRLVMASEADAEALEKSLAELKDAAVKTLLENVSKMNDPGKMVVSAVLGAALTAGMLNMSGCLDKQDRNTISNNSGIIINNSAINLNVDPARISKMVDSATRDNARLTKQVLSALKPAGPLSDGTVSIGDAGTNLVVSAEAAKIVARTNPEDLKPRIEVRRIKGTPMNIRAIDLDKKTSGWAAVFPEISTNRIRITVADGISLKAPGTFHGDIDLDMAIDLDGNEKPKSAHLLRINK
jgi:hypothetical protein